MQKADSEKTLSEPVRLKDENREHRGLKTIDTRYSADPLLMVFIEREKENGPEDAEIGKAEGKRKRKSVQLPESFSWASPELVAGLKKQWADMAYRVGFFASRKEAEQQFENLQSGWPGLFEQNFAGILDEDGNLAASCFLYPGKYFKDGIRIHYVMSDPDRPSRGLGRAAVQKAVDNYLKNRPAKRLYLSTQAQSWPAIRLYESEGFVPCEDGCEIFDERTAKENWRKAREQVFNGAGVRI